MVLINCAPITDATVGTWVANLQDSYGDGWDGAFLNFRILMVNLPRIQFLEDQGFEAIYEIDVPAGAN